MKTIDELVRYCEETDPVGAIMLSGEWGCGKTYLIKHDLEEKLNKLQPKQVLVHVSLFGVDSIEAINLAVKKAWVKKTNSILGKVGKDERVPKVGKSLFSIGASFIPVLKELKGSILSINLYEFLTISNEIGSDNKKVVLVFDDLERTKLDIIDVLGCINNYYENLHFNTIIVVNEEKVDKNNDQRIKYEEIKEKIVSRTIVYKPDYSNIIHSIINERKWEDSDYKRFLIENEQLLIGLFQTECKIEGNKEKQGKDIETPHNIRILKCALQDFYRVYEKIKSLEGKERYLYSFVSFYTVHRSKVLAGKPLIETTLQSLYPRFEDATLTDTARKWIENSVWDEKEIETEIKGIIERQKATKPKDILRTNRFLDVDEEIINSGFNGLLQDCYDGKLTLNEYVYFIDNSYRIRDIGIEVPEEIQWDKVREGIEKRIAENIKNQDDEGHHYQGISDVLMKVLSEDERKSYQLIKEYRESETVTYEKNKKQYIAGLSDIGVTAFKECRLKQYKSFDKEMAVATADCFEKCNPADKNIFKAYFKDMWQNCDEDFHLDKEESRNGFIELRTQLLELQSRYEKNRKAVQAEHTKRFIEVVEEIVEKLDDYIEKAKAIDENL